MKNLLCVILATILFVAGCKEVKGSKVNPAVAKTSQQKTNPKMVMLNPNMDEENRLQKAVDNGGQTWRLNPVDVAHANMISQAVNASIEDCRLLKEDDKYAVVRVQAKDGKDLNVYLERLIRPNGIWIATQIEINNYGHDHVSEAINEQNHMHHHH